MKQCIACGNIIEDNVKYCSTCGTDQTYENVQSYYQQVQPEQAQYQNQQMEYMNSQMMYQNQQQMLMSQQIMEQQKIINDMMQQQNSINQKVAQPQQQYVYIPTRAELSIKNYISIIAAILCIVALFGEILLGANIMDLSSACRELMEYAETEHMVPMFFVAILPIVIGGLAVVNIICAFAYGLRTLRGVLEVLYFFGGLFLFAYMSELWSYNTKLTDILSSMEYGFWVMIAGFVVSIISNYADADLKDTAQFAPRRTMTQGVSDNNSKSLEQVVKESDTNKWICPMCDAKNTGSVCKVCGRTKR